MVILSVIQWLWMVIEYYQWLRMVVEFYQWLWKVIYSIRMRIQLIHMHSLRWWLITRITYSYIYNSKITDAQFPIFSNKVVLLH